jgi:hypothetical protein
MTETREAWLSAHGCLLLSRYFSFVHRFQDKDPQLTGSMYNLLLWEKSLIVGSVADMRREVEASGDPEALKLLGQLTAQRTQIAALENASAEGPRPLAQTDRPITAEANDIEKALVARSSAFAEQKKLERATWQQVRDALGPDDAAVEFARFPSMTRNGLTAATTLPWWSRARQGPPAVHLPRRSRAD